MLATASCVGCTIDNVDFHDVLVVEGGIHNECLYSQAANITINNSRFTNCATMDVFFTLGTWWGQPAYGGWTLTNNFFGAPRFQNGQCCHYYAVYWAYQSVFDRAVVRGNTYESKVTVDGPGSRTASSPATRRRSTCRAWPGRPAGRRRRRPPRRRRPRPPADTDADTQAPSVPQAMAWTTKTQTSIGLRWDASTTIVPSPATGSTATTGLVDTTGTSATRSPASRAGRATRSRRRDRRGRQRVAPRRGDGDDEHGAVRSDADADPVGHADPDADAHADPDADAHSDADTEGHAHPGPDADSDADGVPGHAAPVDAAGHGLERQDADDDRLCAGTRRATTAVSPAIGSTATAWRSPRRRPHVHLTGLACGTSYTIGLTAYRRGRQRVDPRRGDRDDEHAGVRRTGARARFLLLDPDPLPGPRRRLELRRGERDRGLRRVGVGQRRHDLRCHAHREREVRRRAAVRRRQ